MSDPQLRARVLLAEAHALGLDLADLIAADTTSAARIPTVADYLESIAATFTAATAATYRPYWRLAVARLGDRRLVEVTLEAHHDHRGPGDADGPLFRTRDGGPMSARRYDTLFARARGCLDWTDRTPVSAHVLRHTAIPVGRLAGYPVAQAFAGHTPPSVTGRYLHASLAEVASAVATLTGEPHPLAARLQRASGGCRRG